jgi:hypothetical protein
MFVTLSHVNYLSNHNEILFTYFKSMVMNIRYFKKSILMKK